MHAAIRRCMLDYWSANGKVLRIHVTSDARSFVSRVAKAMSPLLCTDPLIALSMLVWWLMVVTGGSKTPCMHGSVYIVILIGGKRTNCQSIPTCM